MKKHEPTNKMNEKPTPETDGVMQPGESMPSRDYVLKLKRHSQKLERERDVLREQIRAIVASEGPGEANMALRSLIALLPDEN